jgi:hypothetical protein
VEKYKEKRTPAVDEERSRPPSIVTCDEVNRRGSVAYPGQPRISKDDTAT